MESAGLFTLATKFGVRALAILTMSGSLVTGAHATAEERERTFTSMMEIALDIAEYYLPFAYSDPGWAKIRLGC